MDNLREELREELARLCHEMWSGWMEYLFMQNDKNEDGSFTIPEGLVKRWNRQSYTDYAKLSEKEKDSDRIEADKILELVEEYIEASYRRI